jgi:hypothetical protein
MGCDGVSGGVVLETVEDDLSPHGSDRSARAYYMYMARAPALQNLGLGGSPAHLTAPRVESDCFLARHTHFVTLPTRDSGTRQCTLCYTLSGGSFTRLFHMVRNKKTVLPKGHLRKYTRNGTTQVSQASHRAQRGARFLRQRRLIPEERLDVYGCRLAQRRLDDNYARMLLSAPERIAQRAALEITLVETTTLPPGGADAWVASLQGALERYGAPRVGAPPSRTR